MRVYVPPDKALMVINKFGEPLPPELIVGPAGADEYKGVQEEVLGPGRYFLNPVEYDTKIVDLIDIPAGDPRVAIGTRTATCRRKTHAPMIGLVASQRARRRRGRGSGRSGSRASEGSAHARHVQDQSVPATR